MCSNFNITLFGLKGLQQHVWRQPVQQQGDTRDQIFMKPEGITVSLFCFTTTSQRNLDWSDGGATPSVILLLIGTKEGGRGRHIYSLCIVKNQMVWISKWNPSLFQIQSWLHIFNLRSYDDEQTGRRLKLLYIYTFFFFLPCLEAAE